MTSLGIRGRNCVVVCTEKKVTDRMIDPDTVTNIYRITPNTGVMMTGRQSDGQAWIYRLKNEAFKYFEKNGH